MTLKVFLLLRGAFGLLFALALVIMMQTQALHGFARGGVYALVDGVIGLAVGFGLLSYRRYWLSGIAVCDGAIRVMVGLLILNNPDMQNMVLGSALFFTGLVFACIALGLAGLITSYLAHRRSIATNDDRFAVGPVVALSMSTLLLGVGLALRFLEDDERMSLIVYAIVTGACFCYAGLRFDSKS